MNLKETLNWFDNNVKDIPEKTRKEVRELLLKAFSAYHVGQRFEHSEETYILSRISRDEKGDEITLICLEDGINWSDSVWVKGGDNITQEDFDKIADHSSELFTLIK